MDTEKLMDMKLNNSKILVTGGAGFIGSNLCEELLTYDCEVVCFDNFSTGKMENILPFFKNKNFRLIVGDIRNIDDCNRAVEGIDYVLHEAALGSVPRSIKDPITSNDVNVSGSCWLQQGMQKLSVLYMQQVLLHMEIRNLYQK